MNTQMISMLGVAAFLSMATKYAEGLLAVKYREVAPDGRVLGGPFYYIEKGLGRRRTSSAACGKKVLVGIRYRSIGLVTSVLEVL